MKYLFVLMALVLGASESRADVNPYSEIKDSKCVKALKGAINLIKIQNGKKKIFQQVVQIESDPGSRKFDVVMTDDADFDTYLIELSGDCKQLIKLEMTQSNG